MFEGKEIVPLQFLKAVLPDPATLGPRTVGKTNIGCIFRGKKDGKEKNYYLYISAIIRNAYREVGSQAVSYTTGVPGNDRRHAVDQRHLEQTWRPQY